MTEKTFNTEFATDFAKLMAAWDWLHNEFKTAHPKASAEEVYEMTKAAFEKALKLEGK